MALIACPDCGKQVSTEAKACPECGRPMRPAMAGPSVGGATESTGPVLVQSAKSRGAFIIMGLFLGCLGVHNFYAGYNGKGAAQLIITLILGWLVIGIVVTAIWAVIEVITVRVDAKGVPMS